MLTIDEFASALTFDPFMRTAHLVMLWTMVQPFFKAGPIQPTSSRIIQWPGPLHPFIAPCASRALNLV